MDKLDGHTIFKLPYVLQTTELTDVIVLKGMTEELTTFTKGKICEGLANEKTLYEVTSFLIDQLEEKDGGNWFSEIEPHNSISSYCVKIYDHKHLKL